MNYDVKNICATLMEALSRRIEEVISAKGDKAYGFRKNSFFPFVQINSNTIVDRA